jgi:hypothetical protein
MLWTLLRRVLLLPRLTGGVHVASVVQDVLCRLLVFALAWIPAAGCRRRGMTWTVAARRARRRRRCYAAELRRR